jgi:hypothetical protein
VSAEPCEPAPVGSVHLLSIGVVRAAGRPDATLVEDGLRLRQVSMAFEEGKSAARKVFSPLPDDVDHLLKLTRCEFGDDFTAKKTTAPR